jgi:hypothetical protein
MRATVDESRPTKRLRRSRRIADLARKNEAANNHVESFCVIPVDLFMSCLAFLSPHDLFLGYGSTLTDHRDQSRDKRLTKFSPLVRFRVRPYETVYDLILRMLSTLRHAFRGLRNKLELLDLSNLVLTRPTATEYQELVNAVINNPLLGMHHIGIPEQHVPPQIAGRMSDFVNLMLKSATNLESYECHTLGGRIVHPSLMLKNHGRLKSFRSDNNFYESPRFAFNLCGTEISEVSLENGIFLAGFSLLRTNLEGGSRECFLCKDHLHLETVNIAGAKCILGIHPTVAN